jgi:hypothetical protein
MLILHFVPFDILSHSTFCPIRHFGIRHFVPFAVISIRHFVPFDVLSHSTFFTFDILSVRRFDSFDILSIRHFVSFDILAFGILSHSTFCHSTFCPVGICYFDILSVNQDVHPAVMEALPWSHKCSPLDRKVGLGSHRCTPLSHWCSSMSRVEALPWSHTVGANPRVVKSHSGAVYIDVHPAVVGLYPGVIDAHLWVVEPPPGVVTGCFMLYRYSAPPMSKTVVKGTVAWDFLSKEILPKVPNWSSDSW